MATPLTKSIFKPTDFDLFLDELGYTDVSPAVRLDITDKFRHAVEYALVTKVFRLLSADDQLKLIDLMRAADQSGDEAAVNDFLLEKIPNVETLIDEAIEKVKNDFRFASAGMTAAINSQVDEFKRDLAVGNKDEASKVAPANEQNEKPEPAPLDSLPPVPPTIEPTPTYEAFPWETTETNDSTALAEADVPAMAPVEPAAADNGQLDTAPPSPVSLPPIAPNSSDDELDAIKRELEDLKKNAN